MKLIVHLVNDVQWPAMSTPVKLPDLKEYFSLGKYYKEYIHD